MAAALSGGIRILQYRNKHADIALKRPQLEALARFGEAPAS